MYGVQVDTEIEKSDDAYNAAIVRIMRHASDDNKITYAVLAEKSGVNIRTVNRLMNNQRPFKMGQFISMAAALGLDPGAVIDQAATDAEKSE